MNNITARAEDGFAFLICGEKEILKAYASPDGKKIRIVFSELVDFTQTRIRPELHIIDFDRESARRKR